MILRIRRSTVVLLLLAIPPIFSVGQEVGVSGGQGVAAIAAAQAMGVSAAAIEQYKSGQVDTSSSRVSSVNKGSKAGATPVLAGKDDGVSGFGADLRSFGQELFGRGLYVSPSDLPVPADYVVGIGDTVEIRLFGKENRVLRLPVERDGGITIPEIGAVSVAGLTLEAMGKSLLERIGKQKIGVDATVSMGPLRSIQIFLMGDVNNPGAITTDALTTVTNALLMGGGIGASGSMRRVEVRRRGRVVSQIDLYDSMLKGSDRGELRLQSGDTVFVPSVGKRVGVSGEVLRPAIYEVLHEKSIDDIIRLAGGFKPTAYPQASRINRIGTDWQRTTRPIQLATLAQREIPFQDGDIFEISAVLQTQRPSNSDPRYKTYSLSGSVAIPGTYEWVEGTHLGMLLPRFEQLTLDAYRPLVVIQSIEPVTGVKKLRVVNLADVIVKGRVEPIQRDDIVFVFSHSEIEYLSSVDVQQVLAGRVPDLNPNGAATGVVVDANAARPDLGKIARETRTDVDIIGKSAASGRSVGQTQHCKGLVELSQIVASEGVDRFRSALFSGAYESDGKRLVKSIPCPGVFESNPSLLTFLLENAITLRGEVRQPGVLPVPPEFSLETAIVARGGLSREADQEGIEISQLVTDLNSQAVVQRKFVGKESSLANVLVLPGDVVNIRKRSTNQDRGLVRLGGEFVHPGVYEIRKGEKLSEVIARAGGLSAYAYPYGAVFLRERIKEEKKQYYAKAASELQNGMILAGSRVRSGSTSGTDAGMVPLVMSLVNQLRNTDPVGRMVIEADPTVLQVRPELDVVLEAGDEIFVPRRPSTVLVMGEVLNAGAVQFRAGKKASDYIQDVGGVTRLADEDHAFAILPDGSAEPLKLSPWNFQPRLLPPGSAIYVSREPMPTTNMDIWLIALSAFKDLALSAASISVISK
jgi:protein involved in polysaccharide export with SLBB domain